MKHRRVRSSLLSRVMLAITLTCRLCGLSMTPALLFLSVSGQAEGDASLLRCLQPVLACYEERFDPAATREAATSNDACLA